nr:immunoglobulin light chain junction region [Macaca mulatta]MOW31527.1 immunoglobulin light chain junction region [Macaca mulatta]MOW31532.1 immunoglobulin light chain junction region [Macaca mulatta]MOW32095.1 immunoglobulin light chain junction region [Macaca mulatta]
DYHCQSADGNYDPLF